MIKLYLIHGYIAELQQIISGTFPVYLPGRGDNQGKGASPTGSYPLHPHL